MLQGLGFARPFTRQPLTAMKAYHFSPRTPALIAALVVLSGPAWGQDAAPKPVTAGLQFDTHKDPFGNVVWRVKADTPAAPAAAADKLPTKPAEPAAGGITFEVYRDDFQAYRWRMKAAGGKTLAASVEGYRTRVEADQVIETIKVGAKMAKLDDRTR